MKKLLLSLVAAAMSFSASAIKLTFYNGDQVIENGSTIYFSEVTVVEEFEDGAKSVKLEPELYLSTDLFATNINITAKSDNAVMLCAGSNCINGKDLTKENIMLRTNEKLDLQFHWEGELEPDETTPTITTEFSAIVGTDESTRISFTIVMGENAASVDAITSNNTIEYTGNGFAYSLNAPAQFALYSITGAQVMSANLNGNGTLATDGLKAGVYVYTLDGKTGKVYVR